MAKTNAEYQREHRERRARRLAELEDENAELRAEVDRLRGELEDARAEIDRLSNPECPHPSEGVRDDGTCGECGRDVW